MGKNFVWLALILGFAIAFAAAAFAQDDDMVETVFDDSTVNFTGPAVLEADTEYLFELEVFNAAQKVAGEKGVWVGKVEITLPGGANGDYVLAKETDQPQAPECLNPGEYCDYWEAMFDYTNKIITWQSFGMVNSVEYGDIREQDILAFAFTATTDQFPSTGFAWTIFGDNGDFVEGSWVFPDPPDDDDTADDDAFGLDDDAADDDDDSDDGCGC